MNDPRFTEVTAQDWTRFLSSAEGRLGMDMLRRSVPRVSSSGSAESAGLKGAEAQGWRDAIEFMESLTLAPTRRTKNPNETPYLIDDRQKPTDK